jgi:hypothetical protein
VLEHSYFISFHLQTGKVLTAIASAVEFDYGQRVPPGNPPQDALAPQKVAKQKKMPLFDALKMGPFLQIWGA